MIGSTGIKWRYAWYNDFGSRIVTGQAIIPLLDPSDDKRVARWREVLAWYGLEASAGNASAAPVQAQSVDAPGGHHPIVSIDLDCDVIAEWYARALGRPFFSSSSKNMELNQIIENACSSITLVGRARVFASKDVSRIIASASVPVGIITASDVAGVSFMFAKQIALLNVSCMRLTGRSYAMLDEIGGRVVTVRSDGEKAISSYRARRVRDVLAANWNFLFLHAHGEGGHANLRHTVLCGRSGDIEKTIRGEAIRGCFEDAGLNVCKRVHDANVDIKLMRDVKARQICHYSCNGFTVTGELFPSDISCALSATEGYAAVFMCNDRPGHTTPEMLDAAAAMMVQHGQIALLVELENDRQRRIDGDAPWLVVGDPVHRHAPVAPPAQHSSIRSHEIEDIAPTEGGTADARRIFRVTPERLVDYASIRLLVGQRRMTVLAADNCTLPPLRISDMTSVVNARLKLARHWIRSCGRIRDYEFNLQYLARGTVADVNAFRRQLKQLTAIREHLENALRLAVRVLHQVERDGFYNDRTDMVWLMANEFVRSWDACFASLLHEHFMNGDLEALALGGAEMAYSEASLPCERCGGVLTLLSERGAPHADEQRHALRCSVCGPTALWQGAATLLQVRAATTCRRSEPIEAEVSLGEDASCRQAFAQIPRHLAYLLRDKGRGVDVDLDSLLLEASRSDVPLRLTTGPSMSFDLHTLRVLCVTALSLYSVRRRIACLPS